jgi:anti-anti-sigma factor
VTPLAEVGEEWAGDTPVARVEGEIDASNVGDVAARLRSLLANRSFGLVVDMTATAYLDSAGINMLFVLGDELRARQQSLRLVVGPNTPIARMIGLTGLDRAHRTFATLDEALEQRVEPGSASSA